MAVQSELSRIESYQRNADTANAELRTVESTLANIEQAVMRVQELALRGNNGALNAEDKRVIALEISGLREQLIAISKTQNESGEFVFSGSRTDSAPYEEVDGELLFVGDDLVRSVNLASAITLETGMNAESVFGALGPDNQSLFDTFNLLADTLSDAALSSEQFATAMESSLTSLSEGLERVTSERAAVGLKMNRVEDQMSLNDSFNLKLQETLSGLQDLDYAKAISEMNLQMVALEAAQKAYTNTQGLSLFNYL